MAAGTSRIIVSALPGMLVLAAGRMFIGAQALLLVLIHLYAEKANLLGDWAYYLVPAAMPLSVTLKRS